MTKTYLHISVTEALVRGLALLALGIIIGSLVGCVAGNKAEVSAIRIEKQSTASEVDQYTTTAGRIIRFIGIAPDAK